MGMLGQEIELLKEKCDKNGLIDFLSLELLEEKLKLNIHIKSYLPGIFQCACLTWSTSGKCFANLPVQRAMPIIDRVSVTCKTPMIKELLELGICF